MKSLALVLGLIFLVSCSATTEMPRSEVLSSIDFYKYTKEGFLITPLEYLQPYESVGLVNLTIFPSVKNPPSDYNSNQGYTLTDASGRKWFIEKIESQEAIDKIYNVVKEMHGDAIMQFDMNVIYKTNGLLQVPGIEITGFAIKRK